MTKRKQPAEQKTAAAANPRKRPAAGRKALPTVTDNRRKRTKPAPIKKPAVDDDDDDADDDDDDNNDENEEDEPQKIEDDGPLPDKTIDPLNTKKKLQTNESADDTTDGSESDASASTSGSDTDDDEDDDDDAEPAKSATTTTTAKPIQAVVPKKPKLSAATLKTKMMPSGLQNPVARRKIWKNLSRMMERSGYKAVQHAPAPTDDEEILPNKWNVLGEFHLHFVDDLPAGRREPVYVVMASKAGEPTLKSLTFRSKHLILITDSLTGRAKTVMQTLPVRLAPLMDGNSNNNDSKTADDKPTLTLDDVFVEAFVSKDFMFDLPQQRYLNVVRFSRASADEIEQICDVYGTRRRSNNTDSIAVNQEPFPKMFDTDPVARYYRLAPSDILRAYRLSSAAGRHLAYRAIAATPRTQFL